MAGPGRGVTALGYGPTGLSVGQRVRRSMVAQLARGGTLSLASYAIAIWAMTVAPIALFAALRETSVLFAALRETSVLFAAAIAVIVLKEPLQRPRIIAAVMIVAGLVLIRLG